MLGVAFVPGLPSCGRSAEPQTPVGVTTVTSGTEQGSLRPGSRFVPDSLSLYMARQQQEKEQCGMRVPDAIDFPYDSNDVTTEQDFAITRLAICMTKGALADKRVMLVGRANPAGSSAYNLDLGLRRAARVKELLVARGVPQERIVVASAGEEPVRMGDPDAWVNAQRVDVVFLCNPPNAQGPTP